MYTDVHKGPNVISLMLRSPTTHTVSSVVIVNVPRAASRQSSTLVGAQLMNILAALTLRMHPANTVLFSANRYATFFMFSSPF